MLNFKVKYDRCGGCGLCIRDCPSRIIQKNGDGFPFIAPENEPTCVECQHCLAVCPKGAISIFGFDPDHSLQIKSDMWPTLEQITLLTRGRRSIRHYQDKNVEPELISRLLADISNAPTGRNSRTLTFTVFDDKEVLDWFRTEAMKALQDVANSGNLPQKYAFLERSIIRYFEEHGDPIFRGAPHAIIVSAKPEAPTGLEDVVIALAYFELLAQSAGLGTVWCGLMKWVLEAVPGLKTLVGIPPGNAYYCMLFGYPVIRFARTVQRDTAATIRRMAKPS